MHDEKESCCLEYASAPRGAAISARGRGGPSALRLALATCGAHCHQRLLHYHCCNGWLLAMHPTHAASPVLRRCRAPCRVGGGSEERRHGGGSDGGTVKALDGYIGGESRLVDIGHPSSRRWRPSSRSSRICGRGSEGQRERGRRGRCC